MSIASRGARMAVDWEQRKPLVCGTTYVHGGDLLDREESHV